MVKFFKKQPEKCTTCGQEKMIFKDVRAGFIHYKYCKECYDSYYKRVEDEVKEKVMAQVKAGKSIGIKEALDITKEVTKRIEAEDAAKGKSLSQGDSL